MATKKKTAKTEDVAVELKLVEESVEQKDVQAVDKAVDAVEEPAPARSVQDHVTGYSLLQGVCTRQGTAFCTAFLAEECTLRHQCGGNR